MILYESSVFILLHLFSLCLSTPIANEENESHPTIHGQNPSILVRDISRELPISLFVREGSPSENVVSFAELPQNRQRNPSPGRHAEQSGFSDPQASALNDLNTPQHNVQLAPANGHALPTAFVRSSFGELFKTNRGNREDTKSSQVPELLQGKNEIEKSEVRPGTTNFFKTKNLHSSNNQQNLPFLIIDENKAQEGEHLTQFLNKNRNEGSGPLANAVINANGITEANLNHNIVRELPPGIVHPYFVQRFDDSNNGNEIQNNQQLHNFVLRENQEDLNQIVTSNRPTKVIGENKDFARETTVLKTQGHKKFNSDSLGALEGIVDTSPLYNTGESIVVRVKPTLVLSNVQSFDNAPKHNFQQPIVQQQEPQIRLVLEEQQERTLPFQEAIELQQNNNIGFQGSRFPTQEQNNNIPFKVSRFPNQEKAKLVPQGNEPVFTADTQQNFVLAKGAIIDDNSFRPSYFGRALEQEESQIAPQGRSLDPEDFSQGIFVPGKLEGGFRPSSFFGSSFRQ